MKNEKQKTLLSKSKRKFRNLLILHSNKDQIYSICECLLNVCNGNIKLNTDIHQKLKKYKNTFNKVLDRKTTLQNKKKILIQRGGFIQFLIPAVITGLANIISAAISKNE